MTTSSDPEYKHTNPATESKTPTPMVVPEAPAAMLPTAALIPFADLIGYSWGAVWRNAGVIAAAVLGAIGMLLLTVLAAAAMHIILGAGEVEVGGAAAGGTLVMFVGVLMGYIGIMTGLLRYAAFYDTVTPVRFWSSVWWSIRHVWPIVVISLLVQLITTTGYLILIIPGIVLAVYTLFSLYVFITEERRSLDALVRSIDLVSGHFWGVFWRLAGIGGVFGVMILIPALLLGITVTVFGEVVGGLLALFLITCVLPLAVGWLIFSTARLYRSLRVLKPAEQYDHAAYQQIRTLLIVAALLGVPILIAWNYLIAISEEQSAAVFPAYDFSATTFDIDIE